MIRYVCDHCSAMVEETRVRYTFRVEFFAAYDGLEIAPGDLKPDRNIRGEIEELLRQLESEDPEKLMDEVYFKVELDLCPKCRKQLYGEMKGRFAHLRSPLSDDIR